MKVHDFLILLLPQNPFNMADVTSQWLDNFSFSVVESYEETRSVFLCYGSHLSSVTSHLSSALSSIKTTMAIEVDSMERYIKCLQVSSIIIRGNKQIKLDSSSIVSREALSIVLE